MGLVSQKARVLAALRSRGARGVCAVDFLAPDVIDNRNPITRVAARILELRDDGHTITVEGVRHGCAVYRLLHDVQDGPEPSRAPVQEPEPGLFTPPPRLAIFDEDIEAA